MATVARHQTISSEFLDQAQAEYDKGEMLQASEKAWGAVAHYVKAVAREQSWPNRSHSDVTKAAKRLVRMTSDPDSYGRMYQAMNALHVNFYEENLDSVEVERSIRDARSLLAALSSVRQALLAS